MSNLNKSYSNFVTIKKEKRSSTRQAANKLVAISEEDLIRQVEIRPILYDKSLKGYRKSALRRQYWNEIANSTGSPVEECRRRWRSLRDAFSKHYKQAGRTDTGPPYRKKKWVFYDQMNFIAPYLDNSNQQIEGALLEDLQDNSQDATIMLSDNGDISVSSVVSEVPQTFKNSLNLLEGTSDARTHNDSGRAVVAVNPTSSIEMTNANHSFIFPTSTTSATATTYLELEEDCSHKKQNQINCDPLTVSVQHASDLNDDEKFLLSCSPTLRRLSRQKNALARLRIQQVLYNIEFDAEIYLALECYKCVSTNDKECATKPGQHIDITECPNAVGEECVTAIISGVTHRGCLSEVFPNKYCSDLCEKCNRSLCNENIYPKNRLRCYQCVGSSCIDVKRKESIFQPLPCPIYNEKDRCYTNIIGIDNVQRGCEKTDLPSTCPNVCLKCNFDGCNSEVGVTHQSCLQCSHSKANPNYDCIRNQKPNNIDTTCALDRNVGTCYNKLVYGHAGKCFTFINKQTNVVQRGCSSTMGYYPSGLLIECIGENCNRDCLDIECNVCNTRVYPECRNRTNILRPEKCPSGTTSCFSCEMGMHLWRGCNSDQNVGASREAICYQCQDSDGCNRESVRSCYKCSSLDYANCAHWLEPKEIPTKNCSHSYEQCATTIISKLGLVYTVRGCATDIPECTNNDPFCERCTGSLCNNGPKELKLLPLL